MRSRSPALCSRPFMQTALWAALTVPGPALGTPLTLDATPNQWSHMCWPFEDDPADWYVYSGSQYHTCADLYADDYNAVGGATADCGAPISTLCPGEVIFAGWPTGNGYGNQVVVQCALDEDFAVRVAHLETLAVSTGDWVDAGDLLGTVGTSGSSTGCHAHIVTYQDIYATNGCGVPGIDELTDGHAPTSSACGTCDTYQTWFDLGADCPAASIELDTPAAGADYTVGVQGWITGHSSTPYRLELYAGSTDPGDACVQLAANEPAGAIAYPFEPLATMGTCPPAGGCDWYIGASEVGTGAGATFAGPFCILPAAPELTPLNPWVAGQRIWLKAEGLTPGASSRLLGSLNTGSGGWSCVADTGLYDPAVVGPSRIANNAGVAYLGLRLPVWLSGQTVHFSVVDEAACAASAPATGDVR